MQIEKEQLPLIKQQLRELERDTPAVFTMITELGHCCPSMVGLRDLCAHQDTRDVPCRQCWQEAIAADKAAVIKNQAYYCPDCDEKLIPQILPSGAQQWHCPSCGKDFNILTRT